VVEAWHLNAVEILDEDESLLLLFEAKSSVLASLYRCVIIPCAFGTLGDVCE
jgi:hypothetical protein